MLQRSAPRPPGLGVRRLWFARDQSYVARAEQFLDAATQLSVNLDPKLVGAKMHASAVGQREDELQFTAARISPYDLAQLSQDMPSVRFFRNPDHDS